MRSRVAMLAHLGVAIAMAQYAVAALATENSAIATIGRVKASIVAVGTYEPTRTPQFEFRGTGFAVGDGSLIATNAHVLPTSLDPKRLQVLGVLLPGSGFKPEFREVKQSAVDPGSDLALLAMGGVRLPPLKLRDSDTVKEGQDVFFTGFPIGAAIGFFPATHRGMISAITPIALPQARSSQLNPQLIRRLTSGPFLVFQLDATAYPGNSGSPIYDPDTGEVLGVVNMVFVKGTKESVLTQPSGITYAVPANHLRELLQKARP
jgi:serine protease Do